MKRILIKFAILILGVLGLLYVFLPVKVFEFSQQDVDQAIRSHIPYVIEEGITTITIQAATLNLKPENVVNVRASFEASALTLEGEGDANFETGIRYQNGSFYLTDISKEGIQFVFSSNSIETIADVRSTLAGVLNREETEAAENRDAAKANRVNSVREFAEGELQKNAGEALDKFLKRIPIYSLNNQGHWLKLAALALDDVTISEDKVAVTLSFRTFILRVVVAILSAMLIMLIFFWPMALNIWRPFSKRNRS